MSKTHCAFCKSPAFGPNCAFSPNKVHLHIGDAKRCCFCGSLAVGIGCPFNPHGKYHVHGIEFNSMIGETVDKSIIFGYLKTEILRPITEMDAYKFGLIDKNGKRLKAPETHKELLAYGPLEEYIIGLKQLFGNKLEMLYSAIDINLESHCKMEDYGKLCECSNNIKEGFTQVGKDFNKLVISAYASGLSKPAIEKLIIDSIFENKNS